jgi:single-stranded DNA-binding protein
MKLETKLIGKVAQHKLVKVEGKPPFLDLKIDVVLSTTSGKEITHWVTCKVWKGLAVEIESQLTKGCLVEVSGRPEIKPFLRRDGSAGAELIVHADTFRVLDDEETSEDDVE